MRAGTYSATTAEPSACLVREFLAPNALAPVHRQIHSSLLNAMQAYCINIHKIFLLRPHLASWVILFQLILHRHKYTCCVYMQLPTVYQHVSMQWCVQNVIMTPHGSYWFCLLLHEFVAYWVYFSLHRLHKCTVMVCDFVYFSGRITKKNIHSVCSARF